MTTLREAAQHALEVMQAAEVDPHSSDAVHKAITALRAALEEPVQEPVAWLHTDPDNPRVKFLEWREDAPGYRGRWIKTPLYTTPSQRKPLSEEELTQCWQRMGGGFDTYTAFARAIELAHGIGGQP